MSVRPEWVSVGSQTSVIAGLVACSLPDGAEVVCAEGDFASMLFPVHRAHAPYCYRCPLGLERATCDIASLGDLGRLLAEHRGAIAGVIVEPMLQGAGGRTAWPGQCRAGAPWGASRRGPAALPA